MIEINYKKTLNYSQQNIYDIVKDIDSYSHFIPGCISSEIIAKENDTVEAILAMKYLVMSGEFSSIVTFDPKKFIIISKGIRGPFNSVLTKWSFIKNNDSNNKINLFTQISIQSFICF